MMMKMSETTLIVTPTKMVPTGASAWTLTAKKSAIVVAGEWNWMLEIMEKVDVSALTSDNLSSEDNRKLEWFPQISDSIDKIVQLFSGI